MITSYLVDGFSWSRRATAYERFWPFFMARHTHPWTRRLHVVATLIGLACTLVAFPMTLNTAWILAAGVLSYPVAWFSHAAFERRTPAAFVNPYWAMLADIDMMILMALGRLDEDVERARREPDAPFEPRRRAWHLACELSVIAYVSTVIALEAAGRTTFVIPMAPPW